MSSKRRVCNVTIAHRYTNDCFRINSLTIGKDVPSLANDTLKVGFVTSYAEAISICQRELFSILVRTRN